LVGDSNFAVLPDIKPIHCFALTAITQVVGVDLSRHPAMLLVLTLVYQRDRSFLVKNSGGIHRISHSSVR
jgi:hypothetical protein